MAHMMAIISKAIFEKTARLADKKLAGVGDLLPLDRYLGKNKNLAALAEGGDLFLFTVRPGERLWLVARLAHPTFDKDQWRAGANTIPITDVSDLRTKIKFASGKGITAKKGALGMSLQTPRALDDDDVALLARATAGIPPSKKPASIAKKTKPIKQAKKAPQTKKTKPPAETAPRAKPSPAAVATPPTPELALEATKEAVGRGDFPAALASLLDGWRLHRHPRLGALVDAVAAKIPTREEPLGRDDHTRWMEICREDDPADIPLLLPVLEQHNRSAPFRDCLRALALRLPDPRVGLALCERLNVTGLKSFELKDLWAEALTVITYHADARCTVALRQISSGFAADKRAWVKEYMADFVNTALKTLPALTGATERPPLPVDEIEALEQEVGAREGSLDTPMDGSDVDVAGVLRQAAAAVDQENHPQALELVLAARSVYPTEGLARVIGGCSQAVRRSQEALAAKPAKKALETWLALAAKHQAIQIELLLEQLDTGHIASVKQRLEMLIEMAPDPRIADRLLEMAAKEEADLIRPQWTMIYGLLIRHAGAESLPRLRKLAIGFPALAMVDRYLQTTFPGRLERCLEGATDLEAILQRVGGAGPDVDLGDGLLRQVLEHPDDDEPRLVYADWLLERGDPRGEFIQLQYQHLSGKGNTRSQQREARLQKKHWKEWIGALGRVVVRSSLCFERGFLAACEVKPKHAETMRSVIGDPMWATVEEVDLTWDRPQEGFEHPALRSLKKISRVRYPQLAALCRSKTPVRLEELQVLGYSYDDREHIPEILTSLAEATCLPHLKRLFLLMRWPADEASAALLKSPLASQLELLDIGVNDIGDENAYAEVGPWHRLALKHATKLPRLVLGVRRRYGSGAEWQLTFERDKAGLTRLEIVCTKPAAYSSALRQWGTYPTLISMLSSFTPGDLTHLTLKGEKAKEPEDEDAQRLDRALARFPGLEIDRSAWPDWW